MATIYMEVEGIKGSVTASGGYGKSGAEWMEADEFGVEVERAIKQSPEGATNREAAHPQIKPIKVGKVADRASMDIFRWSVSGKPKLVKIHICTAAPNGTMMPYAPRSKAFIIAAGSFHATRTNGTVSVCDIACSIGRTSFISDVPCCKSTHKASKP